MHLIDFSFHPEPPKGIKQLKAVRDSKELPGIVFPGFRQMNL